MFLMKTKNTAEIEKKWFEGNNSIGSCHGNDSHFVKMCREVGIGFSNYVQVECGDVEVKHFDRI